MRRWSLVAAGLAALVSLSFGGRASATSIVVPKGFDPGPLAVTSNGTLFIASGSNLYEVEGTHLRQFARAAQQIDFAIAGPAGAVYLGEPSEVQAVSQESALSTVVHAEIAGLGSAPNGAIYVVTSNIVGGVGDEIEQLVNDKLVLVAKSTAFVGAKWVSSRGIELGNVAADGEDDLYVSGIGENGYSLYELTKSGQPRFVSQSRGANGKAAPLSIGPDGAIFGEWQQLLYRASGGGISDYADFGDFKTAPLRGFLPAFVSSSTKVGSPLYADSTSGNGWGGADIVAIYPNHRTVVLWSAS
jgi:hypothetical protein